MKIGFLNMDLIKKGSLKVVKVATIGLVLVGTLSACNETKLNINGLLDDIFIEINEERENTDSNGQITIGGVTVDTNSGIRDVSEDYEYIYIGDTSAGASIVASPENIQKYKDTDNAFTRESSLLSDTEVSMTEDCLSELLEYLKEAKVSMPYSELFNLENLMKRDINEEESHTHTFTLEDGYVSPDALYEIVKRNNAAYNSIDYIRLSDEELKHITAIVAESLNFNIDNNEYLDMEALLCNLGTLKVFGEVNVTNARITYDNVLAISYEMIENLQKTIDTEVDAFDLTISHEANHIPQLNCDDEIDKTTGNIIGFNRKWSDEPINSLFWKWYYEASAETNMTNELDTENIVYENHTNYLKYLKLTLALDPDFDIHSLEEVSTSRNREDFYRLFKAETEEDKLRIAEMMYAIELIQNENDDFESIYISYFQKDRLRIGTEEWISIKRELKSAIAINLSTMFYERLATEVATGNLTLNDIYYLITVFEAEIESHNTYDSIDRFVANRPFMESYIGIQDAFFNSLTSSYSYEELIAGFDHYSLKDESDLEFVTASKEDFIIERQKELIESTTTNIRTFYSILSKQYEISKTLDMD